MPFVVVFSTKQMVLSYMAVGRHLARFTSSGVVTVCSCRQTQSRVFKGCAPWRPGRLNVCQAVQGPRLSGVAGRRSVCVHLKSVGFVCQLGRLFHGGDLLLRNLSQKVLWLERDTRQLPPIGARLANHFESNYEQCQERKIDWVSILDSRKGINVKKNVS